MKRVEKIIITMLLMAGIAIAGKFTFVGGGYYSHDFFNKSGTTFLENTNDRFVYVDQQFYFNSNNRAKSSIVYNGYAAVWTTMQRDYSSSTLDSCYLVMWMTDYNGYRTPTGDSVEFGPFTLSSGDTVVYRLSDQSLFGTQPGVKIRFKRQSIYGSADSQKVGLGCVIN